MWSIHIYNFTLKLTIIYIGYCFYILFLVTLYGSTKVSGTLLTGTVGPSHTPLKIKCSYKITYLCEGKLPYIWIINYFHVFFFHFC